MPIRNLREPQETWRIGENSISFSIRLVAGPPAGWGWEWKRRAGRRRLGMEKTRPSLEVSTRRSAVLVEDSRCRPFIFPSIVLAIMLFASESQATSYGCYITGYWRCYPTPQKCYNYGSAPVERYSTYKACSRKVTAPKATIRTAPKNIMSALPGASGQVGAPETSRP
jgi:hypothetical protein